MMKHILIFLTVFLLSLQCNAQTLHISWRGESHDVYLGCLNCSRYDSNSIWNSYGNYGSKYDSKSIWNKYGDYGGSYSTYSPFYNYANYPPAIVDKDGNFYGYFTISSTKSKRANFDLVNIIYKHYEEIREDVSEWYDKIFN